MIIFLIDNNTGETRKIFIETVEELLRYISVHSPFQQAIIEPKRVLDTPVMVFLDHYEEIV